MSGRPDAPVVFLHPVALDARAADGLDIPGLIAPSLAGHGGRDRARPGVTLDDMADEILGWTRGRVHLVGCSMGGMVAQHFALRHPDRVASLLLAFTSARVDRDVSLARARDTEQRGAEAMLESTMQRWFTPEALAATPSAPGIAYARERLLNTRVDTIADDWRAIADHDVLDRLGSLAGIPTTCLAGTRDLSSPVPALEALADGIPGARLVLTDLPHMGFLESPTEFSALVREHLDHVGGSA